MEEVLPLHVSQSRGVAPEEVYGTGKGKKSVLKGESELDQVSLVCIYFVLDYCVYVYGWLSHIPL